MTETVQSKLRKLIELSQQLLAEVRKDSPDPGILKEILKKRQQGIDQLEKQSIPGFPAKLSKEDKRSLEQLFETFSALHAEIEKETEKALEQRSRKLADATKRRQAEDGYHLLEKPDISYY